MNTTRVRTAVGLLGGALVLWLLWSPPGEPPGASAPSEASASRAAPDGASAARAASARPGGRSLTSWSGPPASALEEWPAAYQPSEIQKVGEDLGAWLAERPAREADPDERVRIDCSEAPCMLSFTCDRAVADVMDFEARLVRQMRQLGLADNPVVLAQPGDSERQLYVAYYAPPSIDASELEPRVRQRLSELSR